MYKDKALALSICLLAICILISASMISEGMKMNGNSVNGGLTNIAGGLDSVAANVNHNNEAVFYGKKTYDLSTAADYLGITQTQLIELVNTKDSGIPFIKIRNEYIFDKDALAKWLETARVEIK